MKAVVISIAAAVLASGPPTGGQAETEEIVIADTLTPDFEHVDWAKVPGVYLVAPRALKKRMETAVAAAQKTKDLLCLREATCSWLETAAPLLFLRGILGNGSASMDGFVCSRRGSLAVLRYYSANFIDRGLCLPLFWDAETGTYAVGDR